MLRKLSSYTTDDLIKISEEKGISVDETIKEIELEDEYERLVKSCCVYNILDFDNTGKKFTTHCYMLNEFKYKSEKFKDFFFKYSNAVKTARITIIPSFKLQMMKKKLARLEKREGLRRYTKEEVNKKTIKAQQRIKEIKKIWENKRKKSKQNLVKE